MTTNNQTQPQPQPQLEVRFDLMRRELMIRFWTEKHAKDYQMKNPEAHFFADARRTDVYLPILPSMRYIRACSEELAICFTTPEAAQKWSERSILGHQRHYNKTEVSIKRNRTAAELDTLLRPSKDAVPNKAKGGKKDGRLPSRQRDRPTSPGPAQPSKTRLEPKLRIWGSKG
jgi:hypothetical protein